MTHAMTTTSPVETRHGTVVFTDLVGFTEYNDVAGDAAALSVLDEQTRIVAALLEEPGQARVVKELGDGLMLWFESPVGALEVAVGFQQAVSTARDAGRFPIAVRIGMHHGEAVVRGSDFIGRTINVASRVADVAGPGEVLASEQFVAEVTSTTPRTFAPIGPVRIKGVHDPIWLYRLVCD